MGAKRFALGTVTVFLIVAVVVLVATYIYLAPPRPDPVLIGGGQVKTADLPGELKGESTAELQARLDDLVAEGKCGQPELWWSTRLEIHDIRTVRLLAKHLHNSRTAIHSLIWLAHELKNEDDHGAALDCLDSAESESRKNGFTEEVAQCHASRGRCLASMGLYYSAIDEFEKSVDLYLELDLPDRLASTYTQLGGVHGYRLYDDDKGLEYIRKALALGDRLDPQRLSTFESLYALSLSSAGQYSEAIEIFESSAGHAMAAGKRHRAVMQKDSADRSRILLNDPQFQGLSVYRDDVGIRNEGDFDWDFTRYIWLPEYCELLEDEQQAIDFLQATLTALKDLEEEIDPDSEMLGKHLNWINSERIAFLGALGEVYLRLDFYSTALNYFRQADALLDHDAEFIMPRERMEVNLAQAYVGLEQYAEALPLLEADWEQTRECLAGALPVDPRITMLLGKCHMELGDLAEADRCLVAAEEVIKDVETPHWLRMQAQLETYKGNLAAVQGDAAAEYVYRNSTFHLLVIAGGLFPWDSGYRHGLADETNTAAERLVPLLRAAGDEDRANAVLAQVDLADRARELEFAPIPEEPDEFTQLLIDYRTTMRQLCNLRSDAYWLTSTDELPSWEVYSERRDLDWKYRREIIRQSAQLHKEVRLRIEELETLAHQQCEKLWEIDSDLASVVTLTPRFIKENMPPGWFAPSHSEVENEVGSSE